MKAVVQPQSIPLALIDDTDRLRPVSPPHAALLVDELRAGVTLPPVLVRPVEGHRLENAEEGGPRYVLVCGGHRMEAHRLAGLKEIQAYVKPMSAAEARIHEVDENLVRNNLDALDLGVMLAAREGAWVIAYPETKHGGDRKSQKRQAEIKSQTLRLGRFSADAAEKVGLSERSVQAYIELAKSLSPAAIGYLRLSEIRDNAAELRRVASHVPDDQIRIAATLAKGEARSVTNARVLLGMDAVPERDPQERVFNTLVDLWSRANARTRQRFQEHQELVANNGRGI